jgi:hypothetical protein
MVLCCTVHIRQNAQAPALLLNPTAIQEDTIIIICTLFPPDIISSVSASPRLIEEEQWQRASMRNSSGWDGKLRVAASPATDDSDYSDEDAPSVEQIEADEGRASKIAGMRLPSILCFPFLSRFPGCSRC